MTTEDRYWIKVDGTDINQALMETTRGVWFGDVDIDDGALRALRQEYDQRITTLGSPDKTDQLLADLQDDVAFLAKSHAEKSRMYATKLGSKTTSQEKLKVHVIDTAGFVSYCGMTHSCPG